MWSVTSPRPYQVAMISSPKGEGFPPSPEGTLKQSPEFPGRFSPSIHNLLFHRSVSSAAQCRKLERKLCVTAASC